MYLLSTFFIVIVHLTLFFQEKRQLSERLCPGIVYIINSSRKGYPRGMNWDVTKFVNIQSLGQVLEHDKKISEKILETNK